MSRGEAKFCRDCGARMERRTPLTEDRDRAVCPVCGFVDYVNPINVVGTLPIWTTPQGATQVLLCLRAIQPRRGYWTLPAGFLEVGESSPEGALRETWEEAGAKVSLDRLYTVLDVPHTQQVHLYWLAALQDTTFAPGPESLRVQLFDLDEIPWDRLAFQTVRTTLELYLADLPNGTFGVHHHVIRPSTSMTQEGG